MCGTRLHTWTKFSDDWLKLRTYIAENVTISFKHEYRRPILTPRCDVISDVINIRNNFSGIISDDLSISDAKINLSKIFRNFQNGRHFEVQAIFQTGSCTEFGVLHQERPCLSLHFELLFDVVAQKLTELWRFQNLTYFLTSWPDYLTFDLYDQWVSTHDQDTHLGQVWWWLVEWCGPYPANNLHPDRQIDRQTDKPSDEHTYQNWKFWQVTNRWKGNRRLRTCQNLLLCLLCSLYWW